MSDPSAKRRIPAIPEPIENLENHNTVLLALKESVEVLQGQRRGTNINNAAWPRGEALDFVAPRLRADVSFFHGLIPTNSQLLYATIILRDSYFLPAFGGSLFACAVAPTGSYTLNMSINDQLYATVNFAASASTGILTPVATASDVSRIYVSRGDRILVRGQPTADATISGIYGAFQGNII